MPAADQRLPGRARLKRPAEFERVRREGRQARSALILLSVAQNAAGGERRLGLVVPARAVGGAVERNRVKRWLREVFRHERDSLPPSVDVVIVARAGAQRAGYPSLREAFLAGAERMR